MAASPPSSPSASPPRTPTRVYILANQKGVTEIKKIMASGELIDEALRIEIPRLERLDAAPGICKALRSALANWKRNEAPHQDCYILQYKKVKAAATASRNLRKVSAIVESVNANPANLRLYTRLQNIAGKMHKSARPLPPLARRRVRRVADRILRLASRGERYGVERPERIRYHVDRLVKKMARVQGKAVILPPAAPQHN